MLKKFTEPFFILTKNNSKRLIFVFLMMIVSVIFDVLSIGILLPLFSEIINDGSAFDYINIKALSELLNSENLYILYVYWYFHCFS